MGGSNEMGSDEDRKKLNDDMVEFVSKRTGAEVPRLAARLKSYVDLQNKRQRALAARRYHNKKDYSTSRKKTEGEQKDKTMENTDKLPDDEDRVRRRNRGETRSRSDGPYDRCGLRRRRRRRRSCRRRRRRCPRKRRRRSCRRRKRRRRSCSRRRRRRSCRRRRRRRRRRC